MTPTSQGNKSSLKTNGHDINGFPRDQSTHVPARTIATPPSLENGTRSNLGFANGHDLLRMQMFLTRGTMELPINTLAGASFARQDVTLRELAATIPRAPQTMTPRHDLLQLLFLLRSQSTLPVPIVPPVFQSGVSISELNPVVHGGVPQGGVPRAAADDAYLLQLLHQRNAGALGSIESTSRLLQQQLWHSALITRSGQQELPLPADITTFLQSPTRRETSSSTVINANTIPLSLPVCLSRPADAWKLTEYQGLLRQQIQVFAATFEDADTHMRGRNKPVTVGQVGIRCRHCARVPVRFRQRGSTYFPSTKFGIYQAAQNMATAHFPVCAEVPASLATELQDLRATSTAGAGRRYWVESATELGLVDTEDAGMRVRRDERGTSREAAAVLQM